MVKFIFHQAIDESYTKQLQTPFVKSKDETKIRTLDYENVVFLSCNEEFLRYQNLFHPLILNLLN